MTFPLAALNEAAGRETILPSQNVIPRRPQQELCPTLPEALKRLPG